MTIRSRFVPSDRSDVRQVRDAVASSVRRLDERVRTPFGSLTDRKDSDVVAGYGEIVCCDPTNGGFSVILPRTEPSKRNQLVTIKNITSSVNPITVYGGEGETIDGQAQAYITSPHGGMCLACDGENWIVIWNHAGGTPGSVPFSGYQWNYLSELLPDGTEPTACWKFDGTSSGLLDRTSNGLDLEVHIGTEGYQPVDGFMGLVFSEDEVYKIAGDACSALRTTGDLTIELIHTPSSYGAADDMIIFMGWSTGPGDVTEAYNVQYRIAGMYENQMYEYLCEKGASVVVQKEPVFCMAHIGKTQYFAFTRDGDTGDLNWYLDGSLTATEEAVDLPTGGGSSVFRIGSNQAVAYRYHGIMHSIRISKTVLTESDISETWRLVRSTITSDQD